MISSERNVYVCTKEAELAKMQTEVMTLRENQLEIKSEIQGLRNVYDLIHELTVTVTKSTETGVRTSEDIKDIKEDLKIIKSKDGKRYNDVVSGVVKTILTLVLGFLFSKLF